MTLAKRHGTKRVFHRTSRDTATDIRIMGFYDSSDAVGAGPVRMGVWGSDQPMDASESDRHARANAVSRYAAIAMGPNADSSGYLGASTIFGVSMNELPQCLHLIAAS